MMLELEIFFIFLTSLVFTFAAIPLIVRFAHVYGLHDQPDLVAGSKTGDYSRRIHDKPIPRLGGVAMVTGFFASMLIWASPLPIKSIYFASLIIFLVGVLDDIFTLSAITRLISQIAASLFAIWFSGLSLNTIYLTQDLVIHLHPVVGTFVSLFVLVGAINAVNLSDGLDGLAGGLVLIGVLTLSMLYFLSTHDLQLFVCLSVPIIGSVLGFLRYNTHPATIFMGDGGSNWLGFMVGILVLFASTGIGIKDTELVFAQYRTVPFISSLACLSVPIIDTAIVIVRRLIAGKSPLSADKNHFHHTLMNLGFSHPQSVSLIYFIAFLAGVAGMMPVAFPRYEYFVWIPYLTAMLLILLIPASLRLDLSKVAEVTRATRSYTVSLTRHRTVRRFVHYIEIVNRYGIYCILAIAPLLAGVPPRAIGFAAMGGLFLLVLSIFVKDHQNFFVSFVISITSSIVLTAVNFNTLFVDFMGNRYNIHFLYNYAFIALMVMSFIYLILTMSKRSLFISPTDFLVVSLPLLYLFVPDPYQSDYRLSIISLRSLVLFIAIRAITKRQFGAIRRVRTVNIFALLYIVMTSLLGLRVVY